MKYSILNGLLLAVLSAPAVLADPAPLSHDFKLYFSYPAQDTEAYKLLEWKTDDEAGASTVRPMQPIVGKFGFQETGQEMKFMWSNNTNESTPRECRASLSEDPKSKSAEWKLDEARVGSEMTVGDILIQGKEKYVEGSIHVECDPAIHV